MSSFLITGATGFQGGATARNLLSQGATVHALVRTPTSPAALELQRLGAVLFPGDFDNVEAITAATAGVSGLFLNLFPKMGTDLQQKQAQNFITAALAAKSVKTVVVSTAFNCGDSTVWGGHPMLDEYYGAKAAVENAVKKAGFENVTLLRPAWLMHNYLIPQSARHFPELATEGVLAHIYSPETRMPHLDAADVGKFAAAALLEPERFSGHEIELGFENLTIGEASAILNKAVGFEVPARKRSEVEVEGLGGKVATLPFMQLANEKDLSIDGKALQEKYGIRLTTFEEYLKRERETLGKSIGNNK